jgi:dihydrodipicolinate synthase/N-acetylneuraminate lyase
MKAMMDLIGLAGGPVRPPLVNLLPQEIEVLRMSLDKWKPWL